MNDKWISCAVSPYSGGGCTATEFLCSVSHCCDNVTSPLSQDDHTGSSTDEYELDDVDDNTQPPVTNSSNTVGFVAAAVSMPIGGCRARRPAVAVSLVSAETVDVVMAAELAVL